MPPAMFAAAWIVMSVGYTYSGYEKLLSPRTRLVSVVHLSNALGTINPVREIIALAHRRNIPVLIDGGFRRGTDVLKALAFGAKAVLVGRPPVWGLGAFGQAGDLE